MRRILRATTLLLIGIATAALGSVATAEAQQPVTPTTISAPQQPVERRTMLAVRMEDGESITLDGRIDEAVWKRTVPATNFMQLDPNNGQPATEPTEVRIAYTSKALYMGVTCFDSEPEKFRGFQRRRDEYLLSDDRFMFTIDTFMDGRTAYFFEMNPSGLMGDALMNMGVMNRQWDGIWNARARRSEIGWTVEIEIPFSTLNFNPNAESWGINFRRSVQHKNEDSLWMGWLRNQGLMRMANAGLLLGIRNVSQTRGVELRPYVLGTALSSPGRGNATVQNDAQAGLDVSYDPTPVLRSKLTINTDFAQTEVDQRLTNLTRFPLFFPEKRAFFLDGSGFFDFVSTNAASGPAGLRGDATIVPYFTRRIGLDAAGNPQTIKVGGRLTGQIGKQDVGLMYVRTGSEEAARGEDFTVARVKRRIFQQSYVGVLYTGRNTRGADVLMRHTIGADFQLATSTFRGRQNLNFTGFFLRTAGLRTRKNSAYGLSVEYPNDPWSAALVYREVQDNYHPEVGFTLRSGYRRINPSLEYSYRPRQHRYVRRLAFGAQADLYLDNENNSFLTREWNVTLARLETHSQDSFEFRILPKTYELLERNFSIAPGIVLPIGNEYTYSRYRLQMRTAGRRVIVMKPALEWGKFYSGDRRTVSIDLTLNARPGVIMYFSGEWNRVRLAEGHFNTRLYRLTPEVQLSPWISLVNTVQYDSVSNVLGSQSRFRWIIKPGNDLYIVYTRNWLDDPILNRFVTLDWQAASKVIYTHRF